MDNISQDFLDKHNGILLNRIGLYPGTSGFADINQFKVGDTFGNQTIISIRLWQGLFEIQTACIVPGSPLNG